MLVFALGLSCETGGLQPLGVQLAQCEQFVTRAQKRLAALDEERVKLVSELEEGQARLQRLRVETAQSPPGCNPAAPVPPPGSGAPTIAVTRDSVKRDDSVASKAFGRGVAGPSVGGRRSASGILSLQKEDQLDPTPPWPWWA